mgnify:FL=1
MKKILAIAMALVMMMAICVPAFAAVTGGSNAGNDTIISTDTLKDEDGDGVGETDPSWYTVTIPATQVLPWEATATNIKYTVASQLKTGDAVKVTVDDADKAYKMTAAGGELKYSLENAIFTAPSAVYDAETSVTVKVALNDWKSVAIDSYTDTLTFTAEIV